MHCSRIHFCLFKKKILFKNVENLHNRLQVTPEGAVGGNSACRLWHLKWNYGLGGDGGRFPRAKLRDIWPISYWCFSFTKQCRREQRECHNSGTPRKHNSPHSVCHIHDVECPFIWGPLRSLARAVNKRDPSPYGNAIIELSGQKFILRLTFCCCRGMYWLLIIASELGQGNSRCIDRRGSVELPCHNGVTPGGNSESGELAQLKGWALPVFRHFRCVFFFSSITMAAKKGHF